MSIAIATQGAWIPSEDHLGTRLAMVRQRMGWNQKEAADECGLSMNAWARYESGNVPRDLVNVVIKVSKRTGVDRTWLMFGERPDPDSNREPTDYKAVVRRVAGSRPRGRSDATTPRPGRRRP